jgi:hypothetical protein
MATTTRTLARFTADPDGKGGFTLHIEAEGADPVTLSATRDQLDVIADALDDLLADTEEDDAMEEEES